MFTVQLRDISLYANHGVCEEERLIGNNYLVNCSIQIPEPGNIIRDIADTVDYEVLYHIIKDRMSIATPLLETVVMEIEQLIHQRFPEIKSVSIEIIKLQPFLEGFSGNSSVRWDKKY